MRLDRTRTKSSTRVLASSHFHEVIHVHDVHAVSERPRHLRAFSGWRIALGSAERKIKARPRPQPRPTTPQATRITARPPISSLHNKSDTEITRDIRRSIVSDKSLSTYAHNVKIITQNGAVTLKGPVNSDEEKQTVAAKAAEVVGGPDKVTNQLTVKQ